MQLALSDFGVEVKAVPVGLDVLAVTKSFKPDIVFADVLLTKRSGYEVCSDLKGDTETAHIPVVLMWSGFMEIDETKAAQSQADRRLEKPFDADILRSIVSDLVQKTKSNPVSSFLSFPDMPEFEETPSTSSEQPRGEDLVAAKDGNIYAIPEAGENEFDHIPEVENPDVNPLEMNDEEFSSVPLTTPKMADEHDEGGWAHQDLTKFKINLPETENNDFASKFVIPQDDELSQAHIEVAGDFEEISFEKPEAATKTKIPLESDSFINKVEKSVKEQMMETLSKGPQKAAPSNAQPNTQSKVDLNSNMMEKVIREEAREVIESICWKVLPEIAERVIREEINKILRETEKSI
ncbi:MAG: phosphate regulon protein [Bdellovibrio sp. ArHS]|nr:MAG: phosphate regulon protein [Bdellovibrio sp. ArHS]